MAENPYVVLRDLLQDLFSKDEARRFVADQYSNKVADAINWDSAWESVAGEVVDVLKRRGLIATKLFDALQSARPRCADEILSVQRRIFPTETSVDRMRSTTPVGTDFAKSASSSIFTGVGDTLAERFTAQAAVEDSEQAIVYRAWDNHHQAPVAIKLFKLPKGVTGEIRSIVLEGLQKRAVLVAGLSGENSTIVPAIAVSEAWLPDGLWYPYIVSEWVEGVFLKAALAQRLSTQKTPWSADEALQLLEPVVRALAVGHAAGISHQHLKPSNIHISNNGSGSRIRLLDFGTAATLTSLDPVAQAFRKEQQFVPFSWQYGAPEQFEPTLGNTGPWTDVFATALIFIEMITGKLVLENERLMALYFQVCDPRRRPGLSAAEVVSNSALARVLSIALAVDPRERFANAALLLYSLTDATERKVESDRSPIPPAKDSAPYSFRLANRLPLDRQRLEGENRLCTVLCVNICNYDNLVEYLLPEHVNRIIERCAEIVREATEAYGGKIVEVSGHRILSIFGLEQASMGDADRAVRTALDIQSKWIAASRDRRSLRSLALKFSASVTTGRVFITSLRGGLTGNTRVVGSPITFADHILSFTSPGAILIGRETFRQIQDRFHVQRHQINDVSLRLRRTYRVLGVGHPGEHFCNTEFCGVPTELTGRSDAMSDILDTFLLVIANERPQTVTLVADTGLGKSRVLEETIHRAARYKPLVLLARATPLSPESSYGVIVELLRSGFGLRSDDSFDTLSEKLLTVVEPTSEAAHHLAGVSAHDQFNTPEALVTTIVDEITTETLPESDGWEQALLQLFASDVAELNARAESGDALRAGIAAAMAELLRRQIRPILIVVDDLQWADDASLDAVSSLLARLDGCPVFVICAGSPDLFNRRPYWGEGYGHHTQIKLSRLSRRQIEFMVRDRLQRVRDVPASLIDIIVQQADGSPLAVEEILHWLLDVSGVDVSQENWDLAAADASTLRIPTSLQQLAQSRLDRLPRAHRDVLSRAAIIGRVFWRELLADLVIQPPRCVDPSDLDHIILELRDRGIVGVRERSRFANEPEIVFNDAILEHVAYEAMSSRRRRLLHATVANWLNVHSSNSRDAAMIAHHLVRACKLSEAAVYCHRAGLHAIGLGEYNGALRSFVRTALIHDGSRTEEPSDLCLRLTSETITQLGKDAVEESRVATWQQRVKLRLDLGDVLRHLGKMEEAQTSYQEAHAYVMRRDRRRYAKVDLDEILELDIKIEYRRALLARDRGDSVTALATVKAAIKLAKGLADHEDLPMIWALYAELLNRKGLYNECRQAALNGLQTCRRRTGSSPLWRRTVSEILIVIGGSLFRQGRYIAARRCYLQASRVADATVDPHQASRALNNVAATCFVCNRFHDAREILGAVLKLAKRCGSVGAQAVAMSNLAEVELAFGRAAKSADCAQAAIKLAESAQLEADLPEMYRNLAQARLANGQVILATPPIIAALAKLSNSSKPYVESVCEAAMNIWHALTSRPIPKSAHFIGLLQSAFDQFFEDRGELGDASLRERWLRVRQAVSPAAP